MSKKLQKIVTLFVFVTVIFLGFSTKTFASTGFLGGPMWIDPEVPIDGDQVSLSSLFHNAEPYQLTGDVSFYDGNVLLGKKTISINSGGVSTATVSFRISSGDHIFSATIGNLIESVSGKSEPFALSPQTVQLPIISVSQKEGNALNASVYSGSSNLVSNPTSNISPNNPIAPVVDQVNQLKGEVLSGLNDSVKNPLTDTISGIDSWREKNAENINQLTKSSSELVKKANTIADSQFKKYGKVSPTVNFIDRPFAYVKYFFYRLLSFLYSNPIVFYSAAILLLLIVCRFLYKKIKLLGKSKPKSKGVYSKNIKFED